MNPQRILWALRLISIPALLVLPVVCALISVILADRLLHDDFPLGIFLIAIVVGLVAAISLSFWTLFARRNAPLKRGWRVLIGIIAFDLLGIPLGFLISTPVALTDQNGQKPNDVVRQFIAAVQADDYAKAATFLEKQSVNAIRHNSAHEYDFRHYCAHFKNLDSYTLDSGRRDKGHIWNMGMSGVRKGESVGYQFYLDKIGGKWLMVMSEGSDFWDEPKENEPHAELRILTYRFNSDEDGSFRGTGAADPTVLVHRIDHERATPGSPIMAESDGSFLLRVRPGAHQIEYEEIKGKLENQAITYSEITYAFEAGCSYVLNGYSITTSDRKLAQGNQPGSGRGD